MFIPPTPPCIDTPATWTPPRQVRRLSEVVAEWPSLPSSITSPAAQASHRLIHSATQEEAELGGRAQASSAPPQDQAFCASPPPSPEVPSHLSNLRPPSPLLNVSVSPSFPSASASGRQRAEKRSLLAPNRFSSAEGKLQPHINLSSSTLNPRLLDQCSGRFAHPSSSPCSRHRLRPSRVRLSLAPPRHLALTTTTTTIFLYTIRHTSLSSPPFLLLPRLRRTTPRPIRRSSSCTTGATKRNYSR